ELGRGHPRIAVERIGIASDDAAHVHLAYARAHALHALLHRFAQHDRLGRAAKKASEAIASLAKRLLAEIVAVDAHRIPHDIEDLRRGLLRCDVRAQRLVRRTPVLTERTHEAVEYEVLGGDLSKRHRDRRERRGPFAPIEREDARIGSRATRHDAMPVPRELE